MAYRRITNIEEMKKKIKKKKMPKTFRLSQCAVITDVDKFLISHLTFLDVDRLLKRRHTLYYERLKMVLDSVGIKIIIEEIDEKL